MSDDEVKKNLTLVPPTEEIDLADGAEEVVLKRRIDKRLEARAKSDFPWARRFVGFAIVGAAFFFGWKTLNRQSAEIIKRHAQQKALEAARATPSPDSLAPTKPTPGPSQAASQNGMTAPVSAETDFNLPVPLDGATLNTISECTKGANAFRQIDLDKKSIEAGESTIESVFKPVFVPGRGQARRVVQLQNVRIKTKGGEELRLHASPKTQNGQLFLKLFRVADDGLPEEAEFPEAIKSLKDQPLSDHAVSEFLLLSETPGRAIEVERHESWSYPEKAGAQVIWSGDRIFEMQVFMRDKFLACSRGSRAGAATMSCKCVDRKS